MFKSRLYITTYFGHGQCFIGQFLVLTLIETARLNTSSFSNYKCQVCKQKLLFWKFWTIFLLVSSYLKLLLNIFYHRSISIVFRTVLFDTLWRWWKLFVFWRKCFQSPLIFMFFYPKTSNFHNSGMVGCRELSGSSMYNISNVLLIGLQLTLSFKWLDFGLKCLVTTAPKGQSLKLKYFHFWNRQGLLFTF